MNELANQIKLFSGRSNPQLAKRICDYLDIPLGRTTCETFPDGELFVKLQDDVRGQDVFIMQSTCNPVNENLVELLVFIDCVRRASARRITAVLPYFGYARQDRKDEGRTPITAKLVSNLITCAGANRVLAMDLHAAQIQGFFDIPMDHLLAEPVFTRHFRQVYEKPPVFVSPDVGNIKRVRMYAQRMGGELAIIDKRRVSGSHAQVENVIGEVEGRDVLMIDDMIATAGTVCEAAKIVKRAGARRIGVAATHAVLCGPAFERLEEAGIDELTVTDTIPITDEARRRLPMMRVLSVSELLGEAIRRIHRNESVSSLFLKS
ncbi:MAG: ribose-phosphate pyrophosphokinase [Phycisphaerae bacterium]|nr:ribose-phosphate pyrophosphokinase [Phycisphaerae bacterium]NUQ46208.1 ribose-phosphate pyrophosphokinase [Phycisphaerae bacterium]